MKILCPDCGGDVEKDPSFEKMYRNELVCKNKCGYILEYSINTTGTGNITISDE